MTRVVLLPGLDGTDALFRPLIERCPATVHVQAMEYSGVEATSYAALADYVEPQLPRDDFFVLGWSFSGPIAVMLASRRIEALRGIILVGSFVWRPIRFLPAWLNVLARPSIVSLYPIASLGQALAFGYATPELRRLQTEAFSKASRREWAARARLLLAVDLRAEVRSCPVPLLYLRAVRDRVIHAGHGPSIVADAPHGLLVDVPGPHLCLATHPDEAWEALRPFLGLGAEASRA